MTKQYIYLPGDEPPTIRVFQEPTGLYHWCDDALPYLDARGCGYQTRAAAVAAGRDCMSVQCGVDRASIRVV